MAGRRADTGLRPCVPCVPLWSRPYAVAVEALARALGVTKGSFYAHFGSRADLVAAALARWEHTHGAEGLRNYTAIEDPAERLRRLLASAVEASQSLAPSVHVSLLGEVHDEQVRAALRRVSESRIEVVTATFRELGLPPQRARHRARLAYATYLGLLQLARETPDATLRGAQLTAFVREATDSLLA